MFYQNSCKLSFTYNSALTVTVAAVKTVVFFWVKRLQLGLGPAEPGPSKSQVNMRCSRLKTFVEHFSWRFHCDTSGFPWENILSLCIQLNLVGHGNKRRSSCIESTKNTYHSIINMRVSREIRKSYCKI